MRLTLFWWVLIHFVVSNRASQYQPCNPAPQILAPLPAEFRNSLAAVQLLRTLLVNCYGYNAPCMADDIDWFCW